MWEGVDDCVTVNFNLGLYNRYRGGVDQLLRGAICEEDSFYYLFVIGL